MASSLLGLAPSGGYLAIHITADAGGLLHHLFTITFTPCGVSWLFVSVALSGRLAPHGGSPPRMLSDVVLYGVRTFLDPDNTGPRSPNRPEATSSYTQGNRASTVRGNLQTNFFNKSTLPPANFENDQIALEFSTKDITECRMHA